MIGVFDSGVGGLTVVRALRAALPDRDLVYLGDTARVPYGMKSPRTVRRYSLACLELLLHRGADLVVVACNTASATALDAVAEASDVPVIGAVEPGADSALAATGDDHIGVLGTMATVASGAYERAIAARRPGARVTSLACPLFVPLAEEGWTDGEIAELTARRYLGELFGRDPAIDTLVLGCTHYPLLAGVITEVAADLAGREVTVVDSATAMARAAVGVLGGGAAGGDNRGALSLLATDLSRLEELAPRFLGERAAGFSLVDL